MEFMVNHIELAGNPELIKEALTFLREKYGKNEVAVARPSITVCNAFIVRSYPLKGLDAKLSDKFPNLSVRVWAVREYYWQSTEVVLNDY